jgi:hypothetical protein
MTTIVRVRFSARFSGDLKIVMLNRIYNLIFGEKINSQLFTAICLWLLGFGAFGFYSWQTEQNQACRGEGALADRAHEPVLYLLPKQNRELQYASVRGGKPACQSKYLKMDESWLSAEN